MKQRHTLRTLPALVLAAFSGASSAAGFALLEQNASGIGNAYAGSAAVAENASTIYFNPAGMTQLAGAEMSVGVSAVRPSFKFSNTGSNNAPAATGGTGGDAGGWAAIPNGYVALPFSSTMSFGVGLGAPFGLVTEYDDDWVGRFQATKFDIKTVNLNPSLAWKLSDTVSLGAGVNWQKFEAVYERFAATQNPLAPITNPLVQATKVKLDADDDSWGWNLGATFQPAAGTRIGLSYRSAVKHTLEGTLTSTNQLVSPNVNAKADVELPDSMIVSVAQQLDDRWQMLGDISWTGWSNIEKIHIVRTSGAQAGSTAQTLDANFRDTWRVALGATYKVDDAWKMKYGVAWDQTPVKSAQERLVSLPDNDRLWLTVGTQWKAAKGSAVDLGLAYLIVKDTDIDNNQTLQGRGRVTGTYDSSVIILGAQYTQSF